MDATAPEPQIDARAARFELITVAIVLLGGYVFGVIWVIPALAVLLAVGLGFGPRANLFGLLFHALVAKRLRGATATEPEHAVRFAELFAVVVLTVASLLIVVGLSGLAWVIALIEAGICALHGTTGLSLELVVRERLTGGTGRRRGRR
jgi:Domain of unknown function (DUF4395)